MDIGPKIPSSNPATGESIGYYFDGREAAAKCAVDIAFSAFHANQWPGDGIGRATALSYLADVSAARFRKALTTFSGQFCDMGPLIRKSNVPRVDSLVNEAIKAGAKVLVRGGPATDSALQGGAFYDPTLLEVSDFWLLIVQEDVFGPVLIFQTFQTEDEAVNLANDS